MQPGDVLEAPPGFAAVVTVAEAVEKDVAALGTLPAGCEAIVASAYALARELDEKNSATSKSMCARALREAMDRLRELAPPKQRADALDELSTRRTKRRAKVKAS